MTGKKKKAESPKKIVKFKVETYNADLSLTPKTQSPINYTYNLAINKSRNISLSKGITSTSKIVNPYGKTAVYGPMSKSILKKSHM